MNPASHGSMQRISHVAIGVTDLERSLSFYRDLLGMEVIRDAINEPPADTGLYPAYTGSTRRREVFLRFGGNENLNNVFIALNQQHELEGNQPLHMGQIGIHHFGFWTEDIDGLAKRLRDAGVTVNSVTDTVGRGYGESPDQKMKAMFVQDPDGVIVQFDERIDS